MPRDLPGLYFDEAKNRYFPLSSKPKEPPSSTNSPFTTRKQRRDKNTATHHAAEVSVDATTEPYYGLGSTWNAIDNMRATAGRRRRVQYTEYAPIFPRRLCADLLLRLLRQVLGSQYVMTEQCKSIRASYSQITAMDVGPCPTVSFSLALR